MYQSLYISIFYKNGKKQFKVVQKLWKADKESPKFASLYGEHAKAVVVVVVGKRCFCCLQRNRISSANF